MKPHLEPGEIPTSESEDFLADKLRIHSQERWYRQVPFDTPCGTFYLDLGSKLRSGRAIGVECDGIQHKKTLAKDLCRDALMLDTKRIASIYRIDAWAVRKLQFHWMAALNKLEPGIFPQEYGEMLAGLISWSRPCRKFLLRRDLESPDIVEVLAILRRRPRIWMDELVREIEVNLTRSLP